MPHIEIQREDRPFSDAIADLRKRFILPTSLGSSDIADLDARIRAAAFFSARVTQAEILDGFKAELERLVVGVSPGPGQYSDPATVRLRMKELLQSLDYRPADPDDEGTIKDLRTDRRLNLIIRTNDEFARGYGQFVQDTDPETVDIWPCWELVRVRPSRVPRDWRTRWEEAMVAVGDDGARAALVEGRMVARKDSPIWARLSRFGVPHPPFDFNSGMGVEDVGRDDAIALGVIAPADRITPPEHPGEFSTRANVDGMSDDVAGALLGSLGPRYTIEDGVLREAGDA